MMIHGIKASTTSMAVLYLVECNLIDFRKYRMLYCTSLLYFSPQYPPRSVGRQSACVVSHGTLISY